MDDEIQNAFYHQPSYTDRHIQPITNRFGPINDPMIEDPLYPRTRRSRSHRVNYQMMEDAKKPMHIAHIQDVHFFVDSDVQRPHFYENAEGEQCEIPEEERGHNVTISNFTVRHGSMVRLNYLGRDFVDAQVVAIKKNQLSAVSLLAQKRKRIWIKELRNGKINIAPATAYQ